MSFDPTSGEIGRKASSDNSSLRPYIVGLGGTLRPDSSTERAVRIALAAAAAAGARTRLLAGRDLDMPAYAPEHTERASPAATLIAELRRADGVILGSPGYHGGVSGLIKNAIDYIEDMSTDPAPYLEARAVGCVATAAGWQGAVTTLSSMRSIVHALRGWPTPLGVAINTRTAPFDMNGACICAQVQQQLELMALQVVDHCVRRLVSAEHLAGDGLESSRRAMRRKGA